jgi:hypothetical protein
VISNLGKKFLPSLCDKTYSAHRANCLASANTSSAEYV